MTYHQICFTRVSGQGGALGWQSVNASPELSQNAVASFTLFQNANIKPPKFDTENDQQFVLELQTDGTNAFYTGIKCNVGVDERGRSIMFAHSFVFNLNDLVKHPQDVLAVRDDNFRFSIEETAQVPEMLTKYESLSLKDCATAVGLTDKYYITLIQCVFQLLSAKTKNSLHIICDCQPRTIRNIMICIYLALPFEFRKQVSFSTYEFPNGLARTVIFDRRRPDNGSYYYDVECGENNVLSDAALRKLSRYEFVSVVPRNIPAGQHNEDYFSALEKKLFCFDSVHTTSLELYKIAADLLEDDSNGAHTPTPEQLCGRLNELLSAPVCHPYLDQQIQYVLSDIIEYKIVLNEVLSEKLCRKLETTKNQDLIDCGYLYNSEKISQMGVEEGAKYLFNAYEDRNSESFLQIRNLLDHDPKGHAILNHLYTQLIAGELPISRENILSFYAETCSLSDKEKMQECVYRLVILYAKKLVSLEKNPVLLLEGINDILHQVLKDRADMQNAVCKFAKQKYWDAFRYEDLDLNSGRNYERVALIEDTKCQLVFALLQLYSAFRTNDVRQFSTISSQFLAQKTTALTSNERAVVVKKLLDTCIANQYQIDDDELDIWICASCLLVQEDRNPVKFLLENHIRPMCMYFEQAYLRSVILQQESTRSRFTHWLTECAQDKANYSKAASEALRIIRESEKRMKQEQKRQQREERREAREPLGKNAFPSGITGLFRRKTEDKKDDWS